MAIVVGDISNNVSNSVDVTVSPVVHTPTVTNAATNENQQTSSGLVITPDPADSAFTIYYQITAITGGTLYLSDGVTPVADGGSFITRGGRIGRLKFTPTSNSTVTGTFDVQTSSTADASGLGGSVVTAQIVVTAVVAPTFPPVLVENNPLTATDGQSSTITPSLLEATEQGASANTLTFTISSVPTQGTLFLGGQALAAAGAFTDSDIEQGRLTYLPAGAMAVDDSFTFIVTDSNGVSLLPATFTIHVAAVPVTPVPPPPPTPEPTPAPPVLTTLPASPSTPPAFNAPPAQLPVFDSGPGSPAAPVAPPDQTTTESDSSSSAGGATSSGSTGGSTEDRSPTAGGPTISSVTVPTVSQLLPRVSTLTTPDSQAAAANSVNRADEILALTENIVAFAPGAKLTLDLAALEADAQNRSQNMMGLMSHGSYVPTGNSPASLAANSPLWRDLDDMQEQAKSEHKMHVVAGTASLVSLGMSVMYFMWAVRAGSVVSSLLSSMPAWKLVDPLPILDQMSAGYRGRKRDGVDDVETLVWMVDNQPDPA